MPIQIAATEIRVDDLDKALDEPIDVESVDATEKALQQLIAAVVSLNPHPSGQQIRMLAEAIGADPEDTELFDSLVSLVTKAIVETNGGEADFDLDDDDEDDDTDDDEDDDTDGFNDDEDVEEGETDDPDAQEEDEAEGFAVSDEDVENAESPDDGEGLGDLSEEDEKVKKAVNDRLPKSETSALADALTVALESDAPPDNGQDPDDAATEFDAPAPDASDET